MEAENSKSSDFLILPMYLQEEEELSQECQDLISTLPAEPDWLATRLYQYQGFWYTKILIPRILNIQNHFQAHDSDILLATSPKSGSTWLKALTFAIVNRKTYYPNPDLDLTETHLPHPLLTVNPHVLIPILEFHIYHKNKNPDLSVIPSPRLFSTHLPYVSLPESAKQSKCKIVYLYRDPKDLFVSLWHFTNRLRPETKEFNSIESSFEKFCQGVNLMGPFWDHVMGYYKESLERPEKTLFLRFEMLKSEQVRVLKDLAEFVGFGFSKEEENGDAVGDILKLCSFENLSNLEVNKNGKMPSGVENNVFFRRGEVGDGKNFLTLDMIEQLNAITREKLGKYGWTC